MALNLADYERKVQEAIKAFWGNREQARIKQQEAGKIDQGERAGVTAGKNLDGFISLIKDIVVANGLSADDIHQNRSLVTLPGYFRPTKLWDLLGPVIHWFGSANGPYALQAKARRRVVAVLRQGAATPACGAYGPFPKGSYQNARYGRCMASKGGQPLRRHAPPVARVLA